MSEDARVDALDLIATTRAIRRYRDEPIPHDDVTAMLFAATRAQDGPHARQAKALLGRTFRAGWAAKRANDGYDEGSGADPSSPKARMAATMQHYVDHIEQVPLVVLALLVRYREPTPTEGASIYPACQNLLLAAHALGYGGVLTMWHAGCEAELRALLDIPDAAAISATITIGRPVGRHGPVRRKPLGELAFDDAWGEPWVDA
jgi:nitroreductase